MYQNMIDIHSHFLPNVDDGPTSWEESLEMARIAAQDGIRIAVTTPHWIQRTSWEPNPDEIKRKVGELNKKLEENRIPLTIIPGMEVGISENLPKLVSSGQILTLGESPYLLIEIPYVSLPYGIEEIIFNLKVIGIYPILAHPERNQELQKNPKRILELVKAGASVQVTAGSFCGHFGEQARQCAMQIAKFGVLHAVASDAHSAKKRVPNLTLGLKIMEECIGSDEVRMLITNTYRFVGMESDT
ncbi:MAG: CpsB/CapC family capsule biosynthesis tyrosine phosphatase [Thermodesulfobacteriota bacterium]